MAKKRMPKKKSNRVGGHSDPSPNTLVAVAWYRPDQWERLLEVSSDSDELEATHEEWVMGAERTLRKLQKAARKTGGMVIRRVFVDVDELVSWCEDQGREVDAEARAAFASEKSKLEHESR